MKRYEHEHNTTTQQSTMDPLLPHGAHGSANDGDPDGGPNKEDEEQEEEMDESIWSGPSWWSWGGRPSVESTYSHLYHSNGIPRTPPMDDYPDWPTSGETDD